MSNRVANSILSGVLKVTGFVTSTVLNSKPAQKFFKLMPGEVILASLDGFGMSDLHFFKICLRNIGSFRLVYMFLG
jgi:hypothetical protein